MKVYELIHFSQINGEVIITTDVYSTEEKAREAYMKKSLEAEEDAREDIGDEYLTVERNDGMMNIDIYEEGYAMDYSITIEVKESEVL